MHVVHVIARLNNGGPARVLATLAATLAPHGIRSTVLAGRPGDGETDAADIVAAAGAQVLPVADLSAAIAPWRDAAAFVTLRRRFRDLAPDLVHTHTAKAGFLGRWAAASLGLPCLHTYHGHVLHGYFTRPRELLFRALETAAAWTGHCHALTPGLGDELARRYRLGLPWRWRVLPIPVAPVAPTAAAWHADLAGGRPVIGFLGRLVPVKDPLRFVRVAAAVNRHLPVQALICGDGPLGPAVRRAAAGADLPCLSPGFVPAAEALGAMDLLLMTSRNEGLPVAAVEALGAGIPCVAPPVGGLRDLGRGIALASRSVAGLTATVRRLLADATARREQIRRGRRLAAMLAPERLAPVYAALYRRLARSPDAPG